MVEQRTQNFLPWDTNLALRPVPVGTGAVVVGWPTVVVGATVVSGGAVVVSAPGKHLWVAYGQEGRARPMQAYYILGIPVVRVDTVRSRVTLKAINLRFDLYAPRDRLHWVYGGKRSKHEIM